MILLKIIYNALSSFLINYKPSVSISRLIHFSTTATLILFICPSPSLHYRSLLTTLFMKPNHYISFVMCLKRYEVYLCSHRERTGVYNCGRACTPITHIDYIQSRCESCGEATETERIKKVETEAKALEMSKKAEDEYWTKVIDDFFLYVEAKGWAIEW
jgi:hypothetical protein